MATVMTPEQRIVLDGLSWETFERLLCECDQTRGARFAYDQGILEIMSPSFEHEATKEVLTQIVTIAFEELGIDCLLAGSTTFKRKSKERGFEPDASFYVEHAHRVRGKTSLDLDKDPSPELIIEIDLTSDALNKFHLYAALGVCEVWTYRKDLEIWILRQDEYIQQETSKAIPNLSAHLVSQLVDSGRATERPAWSKEARRRIRSAIHRKK